MSGETNSVKDVLDQRSEVLDKIEEQLGLGRFDKESPPVQPAEIQRYLSMSRDELESLSEEDCTYGSTQISQYLIFVQRHINRLKSIRSWACNELKKIVAKEFDNFSGPWEMREYKVVSENDVAEKLKNMEVFAEQQILRMDYLPQALKNLADQINSIKFLRIKRDKSREEQC